MPAKRDALAIARAIDLLAQSAQPELARGKWIYDWLVDRVWADADLIALVLDRQAPTKGGRTNGREPLRLLADERFRRAIGSTDHDGQTWFERERFEHAVKLLGLANAADLLRAAADCRIPARPLREAPRRSAQVGIDAAGARVRHRQEHGQAKEHGQAEEHGQARGEQGTHSEGPDIEHQAGAQVSAPPAEGRRRAVIENVTPRVDDGRFPVKRVVGDELVVEADVFADGHDEVRARLAWRRTGDAEWHEIRHGAPRQRPLARRVRAATQSAATSTRSRGWVDRWSTWRHDFEKRIEAGQDVTVDLQIGEQLVSAAANRATVRDIQPLHDASSGLTAEAALTAELDEHVAAHPDLGWATRSETYAVVVDPIRARFSAWYELFPRSASPEPGRHGTFRDVIARLDYVAAHGLRRALPAAHPPDRPPVPQGSQQPAVAEPG